MAGMRRVGWYAGWNMIAVAIVFQAVSVGTVSYGFTFWIGPWTREFAVGRAEIMAAFVGFTIVVGLLSPWVGRAMDRLPIRALVCTGAILQAVGLLLISMAAAAWQIMLIYATLLAVGVSLNGPLASQTLAVKWFQARRGRAIGIAVTGIPVGGLLLPPLIAFLFTTFGWRTTHVILAGLVLVLIAVPAWLFIRSTPQEAGVEPEEAGMAQLDEARAATSEHAARWTTAQILSQRVFWVLGLALLILNIVVMAALQNSAPRAEDLGFSIQQAASLVSVLAVALILGNITFGSLVDRWDARHLYWCAAALAAVSLYLMIGHPSHGLMLVLFALLGVAEGCLLPVLGGVVTQHFGRESFGQVAGLVLLPVQALGSSGAMLLAWLRDRTGSYDVGLTVALVAMICAAVLIAWLPKAEDSKRLVLQQ